MSIKENTCDRTTSATKEHSEDIDSNTTATELMSDKSSVDDETTPEVTEHTDRSLIYKVIKTMFLVMAYICLGVFTAVTGPTLIDLKLRTHSSYEQVAFSVSGVSAGYFFGSTIGGFIVDRLPGHLELTIGVSQVGTAAASAVLPWLGHYLGLWFVFAAFGIFAGVIQIAGQKLLLGLWRKRSASPLHALHAGYGIGCVIAPLIANPFLAVQAEQSQNQTGLSQNNNSLQLMYDATVTPRSVTKVTPIFLVTVTSTDHMIYDRTDIYKRKSTIEYAYGISAAMAALCSSAFIAYHTKGGKSRRHILSLKADKTNRRYLRNIINPATCAAGDLMYGLQVFILLFLYYVQIQGGLHMTGNFIRAFSIDQFEFSHDDSSYLNTTFWISFTIGRLVGMISSKIIPIRVLIVIETVGYMLISILVALFGHKHTTALWILTQPLAFFIGPLFPTGIGWANHHITMSGVGISVIMLGGSLGGLGYLLLIGYLYDRFGPRTFQYTLLGSSIATFTMAVFLNIIGWRHDSRFTDVTETNFTVSCKQDSEELNDLQMELKRHNTVGT